MFDRENPHLNTLPPKSYKHNCCSLSNPMYVYMFSSSLQCQRQILYRNQRLSSYIATLMFISWLFGAAQSFFLAHKFSIILPYLNFLANVSHIPRARQQIDRRTYSYDSSSSPLLNPGLLCNPP